MRVAVVVVFVSVLSTPSEASQSCMSKTEARQSFHSSHIYWHGADHCWDATPIRRHGGQHRAHHHEPEPTPPAVLPMPSPDLRRSGADSQLAIQAVSDAQRILEEYLEPRPHNNERILDKLVEVLGRPDLVVAVGRLQRSNGW